MAIRTIRTEGDEILRKKSKKVEVIDEKIRELIQDMKETLHKKKNLRDSLRMRLKRLIVLYVH